MDKLTKLFALSPLKEGDFHGVVGLTPNVGRDLNVLPVRALPGRATPALLGSWRLVWLRGKGVILRSLFRGRGGGGDLFSGSSALMMAGLKNVLEPAAHRAISVPTAM